jgi:hypothetical protein
VDDEEDAEDREEGRRERAAWRRRDFSGDGFVRDGGRGCDPLTERSRELWIVRFERERGGVAMAMAPTSASPRPMPSSFP